ncbi:unnamed protein product [Sphagnum jensenii]|uniref:Uncharacterized protein n=1 Tax=Sphagnum jensenii TaxID=128206 RepID=A0ABP0X688_9BRYO
MESGITTCVNNNLKMESGITTCVNNNLLRPVATAAARNGRLFALVQSTRVNSGVLRAPRPGPRAVQGIPYFRCIVMEGKWRRLEAVGPCQGLLRKFGHLHHQLMRKQLPAEVARSKSRLTGGVKVRIVLYGIVLYGNSACSYILMALTGSYGAGIP